MTHYNHLKHAGNRGDVIKHSLLSLFLTTLAHREQALSIYDSHAGTGCYDLSKQHSGEYRQGLQHLLNRTRPTPLLAPYLDVVKSTAQQYPRHYPGSPLLFAHHMAAGDQLYLNEWSAGHYQQLCKRFEHAKGVHISQTDAFGWLRSLPQANGPALIFIDPPYTSPSEYHQVLEALQALQPDQDRHIVLWFPLPSPGDWHDALCAYTHECSAQGWLCHWSDEHATNTGTLSGCGMLFTQVNEAFLRGAPQLLEALGHSLEISCRELCA